MKIISLEKRLHFYFVCSLIIVLILLLMEDERAHVSLLLAPVMQAIFFFRFQKSSHAPTCFIIAVVAWFVTSLMLLLEIPSLNSYSCLSHPYSSPYTLIVFSLVVWESAFLFLLKNKTYA